MSSPADVEKYLNDPELAISHLPALFAFLEETQPEVSDYAVEALENCGPPRPESLPFLCDQCTPEKGLGSYWACTLLGRAIEAGEGTAQVFEVLCRVIETREFDLATRERAVLAFTHDAALAHATASDGATRKLLESQLPGATPRMVRLIESVLNKWNGIESTGI